MVKLLNHGDGYHGDVGCQVAISAGKCAQAWAGKYKMQAMEWERVKSTFTLNLYSKSELL